MTPAPLFFGAHVLEERPRIVGIDFGKKRVGVAVADPLRLFAQAEGTYSPEGALVRLEEIRRDEGLAAIVIGWPLTLEGEEGEATNFVQGFIQRLKKRLKDVEIVKWDERYTSAEARRYLIESGAPRKARRNKERIDAAAAAVILQEYLDDLGSPRAR